MSSFFGEQIFLSGIECYGFAREPKRTRVKPAKHAAFAIFRGGSADGVAFAEIFELRVLGGEAFLVGDEVRRFCGRRTGRLRARRRLRFIGVGGGVLQGFDEVAGEDGGVLFGAVFGGGNDGSAGFLERRYGASTGAGGVDDQLAARGDLAAGIG